MAPRRDMRERIVAAWPESAPRVGEWDDLLEPEPVRARESEPEPDLEPATAEHTVAEASEWLREVRRLRRDLALISEPQERARAMRDASGMLTSLGRITGASLSVSRRQILESPHWREIMGVITVALEPWPEAARAIQVALDPQESENPSKASAPGRAQ